MRVTSPKVLSLRRVMGNIQGLLDGKSREGKGLSRSSSVGRGGVQGEKNTSRGFCVRDRMRSDCRVRDVKHIRAPHGA